MRTIICVALIASVSILGRRDAEAQDASAVPQDAAATAQDAAATAQDASATAQETTEADKGPADLSAESDRIGQAVQTYVAAFNGRDVETLGSLWTSDGVYTLQSTGERLRGRQAIADRFKEVLADEETAPKIAVETASIEFISPHVALERGTAVVTSGEDEPSVSQYSAVYVKQDQKWLIDRVSEEEIVIPPSHYEQLKSLEWMIGQWVDAGEGFTIEMDCNWTTKQNYITRTYKVSGDDGVESSGLQVIGWDAKEQTIRSWLFDSDGGFVSGTWTQRDDQWVVQSVATLADGASGSYTSIFRPQDDGNYTWQKINRVLDGKLLPNIDEITVQRM
jgi:uncharacterized protein (TIGR02246 family)